MYTDPNYSPISFSFCHNLLSPCHVLAWFQTWRAPIAATLYHNKRKKKWKYSSFGFSQLSLPHRFWTFVSTSFWRKTNTVTLSFFLLSLRRSDYPTFFLAYRQKLIFDFRASWWHAIPFLVLPHVWYQVNSNTSRWKILFSFLPPDRNYHSYYLPSESRLRPTTSLPYVYFYDLTSKKRDYTLMPHLYNKIISTNSHQDSIPTTSPQIFFHFHYLTCKKWIPSTSLWNPNWIPLPPSKVRVLWHYLALNSTLIPTASPVVP